MGEKMIDAKREYDRMLKVKKLLGKVKRAIDKDVVGERAKEELRHISYDVADLGNWITKELDKFL